MRKNYAQRRKDTQRAIRRKINIVKFLDKDWAENLACQEHRLSKQKVHSCQAKTKTHGYPPNQKRKLLDKELIF